MKEDKERFEYGQLPVLEKDGKFYSQSVAILKMLGAEHGFYPTDPEDAYYVDAVAESLKDVYLGYVLTKWLPEGAREEAYKKFTDEILPNSFRVWEDKIKANSTQDFYHGDKLTLADIGLVTLYTNIVNTGEHQETFSGILENYPALKSYFETRYNDTKDYFENRPKSCFMK